jgi:hypothetical protein
MSSKILALAPAMAAAALTFGCTYETTTNSTTEITEAGAADAAGDAGAPPSFTCEDVYGSDADGGDESAMRESANNPNALARGGWSQSGLLQQLSSNLRVKCQANLPHSTLYTASFNVIPPAPRNILNIDGDLVPYVFTYRAIATLKWSVEGSFVQRMIDIGNGTAISGPAQGFNIFVEDDTQTGHTAQPIFGTVAVTSGSPTIPFSIAENLEVGDQLVFFGDPSGIIYTIAEVVSPTTYTLSQNYSGPTLAATEAAISQQYTVTIQVAEGTRPNPEVPPTLLGASVAVDPDGVFTLPVPTNAGPNSVEVIAIDSLTGAAASVLVTQAVTPTGGDSKQYDPNINFGFVDLLPNAQFVIVRELAGNAINLTITWGIDG